MAKLLILLSLLFVVSANAQTAKQEQAIDQNWQFRQADKPEWHSARVPGCVHTDLMSAHLIPDPYYRDNEKQVQWIEQEEWEYRTNFNVSRDMFEKPVIQMTFKGLDTYADVYLNGSLILKAGDMFRTWTVDCKKQLQEKGNNLRVLFHSAVKEGFKKASEHTYWLPIHAVVPVSGGKSELKKADSQTRKAPYQYGWDTHPRLMTCGIWKPVTLTAWSDAKIEDVFVEPVKIEARQAKYNVRANITADTAKKYRLSVYLDNSSKPLNEQTVLLKKGTNEESLSLVIPNPRLWWPNGMGKPDMYSVKVVLSDEKGVDDLDEKTEKIGVRTIEVVQDKDSIGRSFYFRVNGLPLFAKGSNHVPCDALITKISNEQYRDIINAVRDANMNMLRVWGGAIYENDIFYDLCDESGILIWQDFMFANAMYPGDQAFLENVRQEVIGNVKRLRNHPSLALWSGNNEIISAWGNKFWKHPELNITQNDSAKIFQDYLKIFHDVIPGVIAQYNPQTFYWSSSPQSEPGVVSNFQSGDYHYYKVWHGNLSIQNYKKVIPRFMGEYGVQSLPSYYTLQKYIAPEDEDLFSPVMAFRQKCPRGNEKLMRYLKEDYKTPKDFQSLVYLSQIFQADAIKIASEAHRINKPRCMGTMFWQFGDAWPNIGWSVIDYLGKKKAGYYSAKKAFANVLVVPALSDTAIGQKTRLNVYVNSDSTKIVNGKLRVKVLNFAGKLLFSKEQDVSVKPLSNAIFFSIAVNELLKGLNKDELVLSAELTTTNGLVVSGNLLYFNRPKFLQLQKPDIKTKIVQKAGGFKIELSTNTLAKSVYLSLPNGDDHFSDNFFDLLPNEKVKIRLNTNLSLEELRSKLSVCSLFDSQQ